MDKDEKIDRLLKQVSKEALHFATVYTRAIGKFTSDNDADVWHMLDVMRQKDLVKFEMLGSKEVVLTSFGEDVSDAGGWIEYNRKKKEAANKPPTVIVEYKKQWYDTPLKILAFAETVVIILCAIIGVNIQSNSKQLEREKLQLSDTLEIRNQKLSGLEGLLKKKAKDVEELEKSLKASRDSLKVKK